MTKKSDRLIETWNVKGVNRRFYVKRDSKGKIIAKKAVKGSNLTKEEARLIFQSNKTFDKERKIQKIPDSKKVIELNTQGRNTTIPKRFQQLVIEVQWFSDNKRLLGTTTGYSKLLSKQNKKEAENDAFIFAKAAAVSGGIIDYDNNNFKIVEMYYQSYLSKFQTERKEAEA